ncbi:hypothetical protein F4561_002918 [Lipingzhangella halophila]|uniref:Uncharacterized protein n=1 Tax=Lipingzhangella halophila TaxID=1783352 RepID=A0A7W7W341_9ACTN|nr:hypothetical protein [Lipingzhangella halophila]MBB4932098.1 hypothetical protein [Lipingzhangella halophila]
MSHRTAVGATDSSRDAHALRETYRDEYGATVLATSGNRAIEETPGEQ